MKIVFFGTPEFAAYSLRAIHEAGYDIAAVVTATDKPAGRSHRLTASPVKEYAVEANLPLLQPQSLKDESFISALREINADLFVVIAFRMMPEAVWSMPPLGTFNLHASLLPRYRGAAPINWAVINGDKQTGVTTFFLKHEIDTGDVIARQAVPISDDDNVGDVHDRLMVLGAELTLKTLADIAAGNVHPVSQDSLAMAEGEEPTAAPKIYRDTCCIDWSRPAEQVRNLVRGMSPYPGAWSTLKSDNAAPVDVKIFSADIVDAAKKLLPGEISTEGGMFVGCSDKVLKIKDVQMQGKRRMTAEEMLRGARLEKPRFC
ncbi:MAG: methionyl-tRNA formyltransferase [Muribaculaceae bacterium]|nr:methionyl-tRNA formyltransferase [Muribaculaceae bacterium]